MTLMLSLPSVAASKPSTITNDGYIMLPSGMRDALPNDQKVIRMFFDFYCSYCRGIHPSITYWGATLPNGFSVAYSPVVTNDKLHQIAAQAYYFAVDESKTDGQLKRFVEHIYDHIHLTDGNAMKLARLIKESMQDVGLDPMKWMQNIDQGLYKERLIEQIKIQETLSLNKTPTFVLGGTYMTHLGFANGEANTFLTLLNAITTLLVYGEQNNG